jgi:hypothetical protein
MSSIKWLVVIKGNHFKNKIYYTSSTKTYEKKKNIRYDFMAIYFNEKQQTDRHV